MLIAMTRTLPPMALLSDEDLMQSPRGREAGR